MNKPNMITYLPTYEDDEIQVSHFHLDKDMVEYAKLRDAVTGKRDNINLKTGDYVKLYTKKPYKELQMSDTAMEWDTNQEVISKATGNVLIGGLGIGLILIPIVEKPDVKSVTVIEKNKTVAEKIGKFLKIYFKDKVKIINDDVFKWSTNDSFDVIYMDIWPNICGDNYDEMITLEKHYRTNLKENGWFGCWRDDDCRELCDNICDECGNYEDNCNCDICDECGCRTDESYFSNDMTLCCDCYDFNEYETGDDNG